MRVQVGTLKELIDYISETSIFHPRFEILFGKRATMLSQQMIILLTDIIRGTRTVCDYKRDGLLPLSILLRYCDALFEKSKNFAGIAVVARNSYRVIIDEINAQVHASSTLVAECLALRLDSHLIKWDCWQHVFLESDCKLAIGMINRLTTVYWRLKLSFLIVEKSLFLIFVQLCCGLVGG
ncbi:hypothetical protein V6N11_074676 [Hibiscus sabdariffa]|uniref:RNase H type-1 domain-containing protein n=1 Tax=Hibiscus sabdariffa TaxID=183260 RepID=A0ABR2R476_9ROSI